MEEKTIALVQEYRKIYPNKVVRTYSISNTSMVADQKTGQIIKQVESEEELIKFLKAEMTKSGKKSKSDAEPKPIKKPKYNMSKKTTEDSVKEHLKKRE